MDLIYEHYFILTNVFKAGWMSRRLVVSGGLEFLLTDESAVQTFKPQFTIVVKSSKFPGYPGIVSFVFESTRTNYMGEYYIRFRPLSTLESENVGDDTGIDNLIEYGTRRSIIPLPLARVACQIKSVSFAGKTEIRLESHGKANIIRVCSIRKIVIDGHTRLLGLRTTYLHHDDNLQTLYLRINEALKAGFSEYVGNDYLLSHMFTIARFGYDIEFLPKIYFLGDFASLPGRSQWLATMMNVSHGEEGVRVWRNAEGFMELHVLDLMGEDHPYTGSDQFELETMDVRID